MDVTETLDGLYFGKMGDWGQLMKENNKILGWNGQQLQAKVRPTDDEVAALGPEFQKAVRKPLLHTLTESPIRLLLKISKF